MLLLLLTMILAVTPGQGAKQISDADKKDFIEVLQRLPHKGEFFTDEAIKKAGPYLPTLLSLTEKDIEDYDIYPFLALTRGLCDHKTHRKYAVRHFDEIRHPMLKLGWGMMLFDAGITSFPIVQFLRKTLASEHQSKILAEMAGPNYDDLRRRLATVQNRKRRRTKHNNRWIGARMASFAT